MLYNSKHAFKDAIYFTFRFFLNQLQFTEICFKDFLWSKNNTAYSPTTNVHEAIQIVLDEAELQELPFRFLMIYKEKE